MNYTRRDFLKSASLGALALSLPATRSGPVALAPPADYPLYIGTYTRGRSEGIYRARMDATTGAVRVVDVEKGITNPSFLAIDSRRRYLYAVSEVMDFAGKRQGAVRAYAIDPATGGLRRLNEQPTQGGAPCHLIVDGSDRSVLFANYMGGNAGVFPIQADGSLGAATDLVQHQGSGPNARRQEAPHAHSVNLDASNRHLVVADLGIDRLMVYRFNEAQGKMAPARKAAVPTKPGAGPRHFAFHPNTRWAYVINELDCTITRFDYDPADGTLTERQTVPTLPADFSGQNTCADIHVHPSGRFVYGSNRGHDSIVVYAIDQESGEMTFVEHESTQGKVPRNFAIDPTGAFLLAANQDSDSVVTFRIDTETGALTPTGHVADVPVPVCLKFAADGA